MSYTAFTDLVQNIPLIRGIVVDSRELSNYWSSGVVTVDTGLSNQVRGGQLIDVKQWEDLSGDAENMVAQTALNVNNVTQLKQTAVVAARAKAWGAEDTAKIFTDDDPMQHVQDRLGLYWSRQMNRELVAVTKGVLAESAATKVNDISGLTGAKNKISASALIATQMKMGDAFQDLSIIVMHPLVYGYLRQLDLIDFIPDSQTGMEMPTYAGKRVVVEEQFTPDIDGNFTTVLYGPSTFVEGTAVSPIDLEFDRTPLEHIGLLVTRRTFILHPYGYRYIGALTPGVGPTRTEFEDGDNWEQVWPDKNIRLVAIKHKIDA